MNAFEALPSADGLWTHLRLATDAEVPAAMVVGDGAILWVGPYAELPREYMALREHDGGGALVTPGLVDCHTHLVYGGQRANEFAMRLAGATYEEVAKAGGGILSSVRATCEATDDEL